jgi:hypothetical protein
LFSEIIDIIRYRCPPCRATHSILPENLLPISRWWLGDILDIAGRLASGETAYAISKGIGESVSSLRRLKVWIAMANEVITALAREMGLLDPMPPRPLPASDSAMALMSLWPAWPEFAHAFSRAFYPKRFPLWGTHTILTG